MAEKIEYGAKILEGPLGILFLVPDGDWDNQAVDRLLKENGYKKGQEVIVTIKPKEKQDEKKETNSITRTA